VLAQEERALDPVQTVHESLREKRTRQPATAFDEERGDTGAAQLAERGAK
jgi:hypothetical protein